MDIALDTDTDPVTVDGDKIAFFVIIDDSSCSYVLKVKGDRLKPIIQMLIGGHIDSSPIEIAMVHRIIIVDYIQKHQSNLKISPDSIFFNTENSRCFEFIF